MKQLVNMMKDQCARMDEFLRMQKEMKVIPLLIISSKLIGSFV